ncbi:MAG: hypothetical protein RLZZ598_11, partial [Pseudomonadota bacterium]
MDGAQHQGRRMSSASLLTALGMFCFGYPFA